MLLQLRAKNIQLERQVQQLVAASDLRAEMLNDIENYVLELEELAAEGLQNANQEHLSIDVCSSEIFCADSFIAMTPFQSTLRNGQAAH
jgi:hypothetical protein